ITQKCDQSGQRDSSEQRQPATSILRHHSMAEVDLERTTPKTTKIVRSTPFYDVSDRAINVLQRTTLECPSGPPRKLGHTLEAASIGLSWQQGPLSISMALSSSSSRARRWFRTAQIATSMSRVVHESGGVPAVVASG